MDSMEWEWTGWNENGQCGMKIREESDKTGEEDKGGARKERESGMGTKKHAEQKSGKKRS